MTRSDVAYQAVGKGSEDSGGSAEDKAELEQPQPNQNNHHHNNEIQELQQRLQKRKAKQRVDVDDDVIKEEEEGDDELDSNNNDPPSPTSSKGRGSVFRRTMSFLATLPRKLYSYVREVFYSPQQRWSRVGHDQDSDESDWSSSEDGTTSRSNKHRRSAGKSKDRHKPKKHDRGNPPPIAPKPKKKNNASPSGSSNPPSSPDTTTPDTTPEISFDDIVVESPQLKTYKRIHGPQGRRKPQRFSNQSETRQSEIRQTELQLDSDLSR